MGIDIGDLETVFMRNVPPSPANYVQRAGRAGRRKDSAAYILTYCGKGSHDYTYFLEPEKMISGIIKPPYFNVVNHKIIERHLMAACLEMCIRDRYTDGHKNRICNFCFALDSHYQAVCEKLSDDIFSYKISNGLIGSSITGQISLSDFNEMSVKFQYKGITYAYELPFNLEAYRISGSKWKSMNNDCLLYTSRCV